MASTSGQQPAGTCYIIDPRDIVTHRAVGGREWDDEQLLDQLRRLRDGTKR